MKLSQMGTIRLIVFLLLLLLLAITSYQNHTLRQELKTEQAHSRELESERIEWMSRNWTLQFELQNTKDSSQ